MGRSTPDWMETLFDSDGANAAQSVKASSGYLKYVYAINPNMEDAYLQLFDVAAAGVTVGTTTPKLSLLVPGGNGVNSGSYDVLWQEAIRFGTAIVYACTTTATGAVGPATGLVLNFGFI